MEKSFIGEEWRKLSFPELADGEDYFISNFGRIKSFKTNKKNGAIIKGSTLRGYKALNIKLKNNKRCSKYVHKLVAQTFLKKDSELQQFVIHLDYDKTNNFYKNLRWVTKQTMYEHQKLNPNYERGQIYNSKLTETDVIRLKKKLKRGKNKLYKVAKEFGITHTQLNRIRSGENWGHITVD